MGKTCIFSIYYTLIPSYCFNFTANRRTGTALVTALGSGLESYTPFNDNGVEV